MAVDLSQLSETERALLVLLAAGHTVKSGATLTGSTENAVNEPLPEARRKTGVGSSRELARLVAHSRPIQKSRDDFSGMVMPTPQPTIQMRQPGASKKDGISWVWSEQELP